MDDDAPNMIWHGSFQRCGRFLDYIEHHNQHREGEGLSTWLERQRQLGDYFWRTVCEWWCSMDGIEHKNMAMFFETFSEEWWPGAMTGENLRMFKRLPREKPFTIYRGQDADHPVGLAWTTDRAKAEWFARNGIRGYRGSRPAILTASIRWLDVAFCNAERNESEVVPFAIPTEYTLELLDDDKLAVAA